jgi:porin
MKYRSMTTAMISAILITTSALVSANASEAATTPYADTLLGDVGGVRSTLLKKGVDVNLNYKSDFWGATDGGAKRGNAYVGAATLGVDFDNEKLLGIAGNSASIQLMNTHGGKPNSYVGSTQGVDNFEVATPATFVYEAWVQQNFIEDRVSALVGLRDLNAEFVVTDMSANFIKPVMQIGQDFAQTGQNGPSVYPVTALAGRLELKPTTDSYIKAAVFDGVAGNLNKAKGTHVNIMNKDGQLLIAEAGFTPGNDPDGDVNNKFAIGAWSYTKQFADLVDVDGAGDPVLKKSEGVYALTSYQFYHDKSDRTLGAFFRVGGTNGDVSQVDWSYQAGVVGHGWVPSRAEGEIGLGVAQANNSSSYIEATGAGTTRKETSFELYYRDVVAPGVTVQPDLQYVVNPGTTDTQKDATLVGLRVDISF